jgi:hypothetical protein
MYKLDDIVLANHMEAPENYSIGKITKITNYSGTLFYNIDILQSTYIDKFISKNVITTDEIKYILPNNCITLTQAEQQFPELFIKL